MHPNPVFRQAPNDQSISFVRDRGFGTLSINGDAIPLLAHVPLILSRDADIAELHLVRSNPISRAVAEPMPAIISVLGPDGYISPDWYEIDDMVPTWNYVAVHLIGTLEKRPQDELPGILDRLSDEYETRLLPKPIWKRGKVSEDTQKKMLRMITPFHFHIEDIQSTWKLGQNKPNPAQSASATAVAERGFGSEIHKLGQLMQPKTTD